MESSSYDMPMIVDDSSDLLGGDWYCRRIRSQGRQTLARNRVRFADVFGHNNLIRTFNHLADFGGSAAGIDGITFSHLCPSEVADIMRQVAREISDGVYHASPTRAVKITKSGSKGSRTLQIPNIVDRTVGRAEASMLAPFAQHVVCPTVFSMGGRGHRQLLATVVEGLERSGLWAIGSDDIRKAFDSIQLDAVIECVDRFLRDESPFSSRSTRERRRFVGIAKQILSAGDVSKSVGIPQGSPLSPIAMDITLNYLLDQPLQNTGGRSCCLRYVDNLFVLDSDSSEEALDVLEQANGLIQPIGLTLHAKPDRVRDLRNGQRMEILGLTLQYRRGLATLHPTPGAWEKLDRALEHAHAEVDPPKQALRVTIGWINAIGPTLEKAEATLNRLQDRLTLHGFDVKRRLLKKKATTAYASWQEARKIASKDLFVRSGNRRSIATN